MNIYIYISLACGLLGYLAGKSRKRLFQVIFLAIAVAILCIVAGARSLSVGTDVVAYVVPLYRQSLGQSFFSLVFGSTEILFRAYIWICSRTFKDVNIVLGLIQLITILPMLIVVKRVYKEQLGTFLLLYSLVFYLFSLNCMKQSISISFLFVSYYYTQKSRKPKYAISLLIACGFHLTAVLGVLIWPIVKLSNYKRAYSEYKPNPILYIVLCIAGLVILLFILFGRDIIAILSVIKDSYSYQVDNMSSSNDGGLVLAPLGLALTSLVEYLLSRNLTKSDDSAMQNNRSSALLILIWGGAILWQMALISNQLYRLGMIYLSFYLLYACERLSKSINYDKYAQICIYIIVGFAFAYFTYFRFGYANEIPYESSIIEILNMLG